MAKTPQVKAKARALFEAGGSLREVAAKVGKHYQTILAWSKKEGWEQGKTRPLLDQKEENAAIAAAEAAGLNKAYLYGKVALLLEASDREGEPDLDAIDKGLTHAERTVPGFKVAEKVDVDPGEGFRSFFQALRSPA